MPPDFLPDLHRFFCGTGDPVPSWPRNQGMFVQNLDIAFHPCYVPKTQHGESGPLSDAKTEFSQATRWMLAVRDQADRDAFSALFDHFAPRLKAMIMRSGTGGAQAEEIVQEVMLSVWRKAGQFDPHRAQVSAWIYQIARNRQIDVVRKERRPEPEEMDQDGGSEPDPAQILALEQEADELKTALSRLSVDQREMIEKAYFGELTQQEIAKQTGLALGTIKSRIRLGLNRLRHELKGLR